MSDNLHILERGLPKWPQMRVGGVKLPKEIALEIVRRTDTFFVKGYTGNDKEWDELVNSIVRKPNYSYGKDFDYQKYRKEYDEFLNNWKLVDTSYVNNSWVSCSFIHGPHGWCHPDGTIHFLDNIGKWPSSEDVYNDWQAICSAFPDVLNLDCVLMDGEECNEDETNPVIGFRIRNSVIEIVDPLEDKTLLTELGFGTNKTSWQRSWTGFEAMFGVSPARLRESAISEDQIREWASRVYGE